MDTPSTLIFCPALGDIILVHCEWGWAHSDKCGGENNNFEITNYAAAIKGNVYLSIGALVRRLVK